MGRVLAVVVVLALTGCTVPSSTSVTVPSYSPVREALAWFPSDAPLVVVTRTDGQDPGLRRLGASGALAPLERAAERRGILYEQWSALLGNPAVVGLPYVGAAPLVVLATDEPDSLQAFAGARVAGERARAAGSYRGADLYAERDWAFAVRDRILIVSRTTRDLLAALDTRSHDESFEAAQLNDVQPGESPPATFLRGYADLDAFVVQAGATYRAVPVLAALEHAGFSVGASAEALAATMTAAVGGTGLTEGELPALSGTAALPSGGGIALGVADLAPLAAAAEDALREALPVTALKLDALRSAGVPVTPDLLAGPAELTPAPAVSLRPARPAALSTALARAARRLRIKLSDGFYRYKGVRAGFVDGHFVAGRASARALRRLARRPLSAQSGPVALRLPRASDSFPRPAVLTLSGSPERLTLRLGSSF